MTDAASDSGSVCLCSFASSLFARLLFVGEGAKLNGLAVAEGVDIADVSIAPFRLEFQSHVHVNEHDDAITGDDESFRLATSFGPCRARLRDVRRHGGEPVVGPALRGFSEFDPLDLRVK